MIATATRGAADTNVFEEDVFVDFGIRPNIP
jgi:hypothetical protein